MRRLRAEPPGRMIHLEFFATPKAERIQVVRRMRAVYRIARTVTEGAGGSGPWAYLLEPKGRRRSSPSVRPLFNVRADEDLWAEVAFYTSRAELTRTIRAIWKRPDFQKVVHTAESLNAHRKRSSSVDLGRLKAT